MIAVAVLLLALWAADVVAGNLSGEPTNKESARIGAFAGSEIAIVLSVLLVPETLRAVALACLVVMAVCGWILPRASDTHTLERNSVALWPLVTTLLLITIFGAVWEVELNPVLSDWHDRLPFPRLAAQEPRELILGVAVLLFLTSTANGIVRSVLTVAGADPPEGEGRLRAGRYIGVIERFLLFGLAIAGQPTAAVLVVSAKSILRFPEISRDIRRQEAQEQEAGRRSSQGPGSSAGNAPDPVTEYFLLGSLTSWLLALAPVLFFR